MLSRFWTNSGVFCISNVAKRRCLSTTSFMAQKHATMTVDDGVAMIYLDSKDSKVNSLNEEVMTEMQAIFKDVQSKPEIKSAVLISKKPGCFIAGADIKMIEK